MLKEIVLGVASLGSPQCEDSLMTQQLFISADCGVENLRSESLDVVDFPSLKASSGSLDSIGLTSIKEKISEYVNNFHFDSDGREVHDSLLGYWKLTTEELIVGDIVYDIELPTIASRFFSVDNIYLEGDDFVFKTKPLGSGTYSKDKMINSIYELYIDKKNGVISDGKEIGQITLQYNKLKTQLLQSSK